MGAGMKTNRNRKLCALMALSRVVVLFACAQAAFSQTVIENPDKPLSKNAGRTIGLKEVLKITDESGEFFFKYPRIAAEGPDGSIYVMDNEQILGFEKDGRFIRNYFKKGQGPGEMTYAIGPFATSEGLCVQASSPEKLVWFDPSGKLLREHPIRQKERISVRLLDIKGDLYLFSGSEFPRFEKAGEQYVDAVQSLLTWKGGDDPPKKFSTFSTPVYLYGSGSGGGGMMSLAPFLTVPWRSASIVVVHTPEYLLKISDMDAGAIVKTISRKYQRIETPPPTPEDKKPRLIINGKEIMAPRQKYLNDISKVIAQGDRIWVVTSTKDPKKGTLIDVFDDAGKYIDAFYLNIPAPVYAIYGANLYAAEKNPDETYVVKKYAIEWKD